MTAALPVRAVDAHKGPRPLVAQAGACRTAEEVRVGCVGYFQPSLVFYCRREVCELATAEQTLEFLRGPLPAYLFCPAELGEALVSACPAEFHLRGRHRDLFYGRDVVVVSNR